MYDVWQRRDAGYRGSLRRRAGGAQAIGFAPVLQGLPVGQKAARVWSRYVRKSSTVADPDNLGLIRTRRRMRASAARDRHEKIVDRCISRW